MGEADILIEYTAPLSPSGLFEPKGGRPGSWQALLAFPFQLCGRGSLPHDSACRVELGALNWTMVASRAIELETAIHISYDLPSEPGAAGSGAEEQEAAVPSGDSGMIYRDRGKAERERGGDWQMVTLSEDDKRERPPVEIVDLSGGAEPGKIRQAIADVLTREAWGEQGTDRQPAEAAEDTAEGYRISRSPAVKEDQADGTELPPAEQPPEKSVPEECPKEVPSEECPEEETQEEYQDERPEECPEEEHPEEKPEERLVEEHAEECAAPASPVEDATQTPPHAARSGPAVQVSFNGKTETAPETGPDAEPTPWQNAPGFAPDLPLPLPETVTRPDPDQDHEHHDAPHHDAADQPRESPVPLPHPVPEPQEPYQAHSEPQAAPAPCEPQPQTDAIAVAVTDEAETLEPQPQPRPKLRFRGVPGLHVEAHDNDIDVTAFHISIKL